MSITRHELQYADRYLFFLRRLSQSRWIYQCASGWLGHRLPTRDELFTAMRELAAGIANHSEFNFLLSNSDFLFAHCATKLSYIIRQAPFSVAHLTDQDISIDFSAVTTDRVALIATTPLTDNERWTALTPGTLAMFVHGALVKPASREA